MDSPEEITKRLRRQAQTERVRITPHAHQEMAEEYVSLDDVLSVLRSAKLIENYPEHKRGACSWSVDSPKAEGHCTSSAQPL